MTRHGVRATLMLLGLACSPVVPGEGISSEDEVLEEAARKRDAGGGADMRPPDGGRDGGGDGGTDADAIRVADESALNPKAAKLKITMVDVGQGDALLIRFPSGKVMVVDGGPDTRTLSNYLTAQGITAIDYAVLSHAHGDHYTGLTPTLAKLPKDCTARVFDPGYNRSDTTGYTNFRSAAGCHYQAVHIGETLWLDPQVEVTVLSAHSSRYGSSDDSHGINNTSAVVRLRYGRFSMLLEGDAEQAAEQSTLMAERALLRSTVLKAGHHGSCTATATSYLGAIDPQYVLISVGAGNSYGLPNCQTMRKLRARRALRWARTDENGTVTITSDGSAYAVGRERGAESIDTCPRDCASPSDF